MEPEEVSESMRELLREAALSAAYYEHIPQKRVHWDWDDMEYWDSMGDILGDW